MYICLLPDKLEMNYISVQFSYMHVLYITNFVQIIISIFNGSYKPRITYTFVTTGIPKLLEILPECSAQILSDEEAKIGVLGPMRMLCAICVEDMSQDAAALQLDLRASLAASSTHFQMGQEPLVLQRAKVLLQVGQLLAPGLRNMQWF